MLVRTEERSLMKMRLGENGGQLSFLLPCFSFDDFDRTGRFTIYLHYTMINKLSFQGVVFCIVGLLYTFDNSCVLCVYIVFLFS